VKELEFGCCYQPNNNRKGIPFKKLLVYIWEEGVHEARADAAAAVPVAAERLSRATYANARGDLTSPPQESSTSVCCSYPRWRGSSQDWCDPSHPANSLQGCW